MFVVSFSISFRFDLNFAGSFFASARLILPSLILSKRLNHYQVDQILHQQCHLCIYILNLQN